MVLADRQKNFPLPSRLDKACSGLIFARSLSIVSSYVRSEDLPAYGPNILPRLSLNNVS